MPDYEIRVQKEFSIRFKDHASFRLHLSMPYISFSSHDFNHVVFSCFWGTQMMRKAREGGEDFDEDLIALSCGPHSNIKTYSMCVVNLVRFVTIDREKGKKTQNNRVSTGGDHDKVDTQFYGVLKEIKELTYNSDEERKRTVVLFSCDWYRLEHERDRRIKLQKHDGCFRSINVESLWYEDDRYILSTQGKKMFYVADRTGGENW